MSVTLSAEDSVLAAAFASLRTFRDVASLLEVRPQVLGFFLHKANNYKTFELRKRSGGTRTIATPVTSLKIIQRKLNQVLHSVYRGRSPVHGFVRARSIVTNAQRHVGRAWILNFDLQAFFPSIHFGRVMGMFQGKPYGLPERVAMTLAQICCYDRALPIGAPTSPTVANMVCARMDSQLKKLAQNCGCVYTRYADDITFSVPYGRFPPMLVYRDPKSNQWIIGDEIARLVSANGFQINTSKTRVLPQGCRQEVTGLVVGQRVNVKRTYVRRVRAMLHACEKFGAEASSLDFSKKYDRKQRVKSVDFLRVLRGKIEFIGSVRGRDDVIYLKMMDRLLRLDGRARMRPVVVRGTTHREVLEKAVWLLEENDTGLQGTGFTLGGLGIITAAHVVGKGRVEASCPALGVPRTEAHTVAREDHVDVARLRIGSEPLIGLKIADPVDVKTGDTVKVLGFPRHRDGASVQIQYGRVTGTGKWHGVPHIIIDCSVVRGNSGGPVLNDRNEVVGVVVKGQETPKRFKDDDELSRAVPIDFALRHL